MSDVVDRPPPTGEGLTFEKVWAMLQESRVEFDRKMEKSRTEFDRKMEKSRTEFDQLKKETWDLVKETSRHIGGMDATGF